MLPSYGFLTGAALFGFQLSAGKSGVPGSFMPF